MRVNSIVYDRETIYCNVDILSYLYLEIYARINAFPNGYSFKKVSHEIGLVCSYANVYHCYTSFGGFHCTVYDEWRSCNALCDVQLSQIEGNSRKFSPMWLSNIASSVKFLTEYFLQQIYKVHVRRFPSGLYILVHRGQERQN